MLETPKIGPRRVTVRDAEALARAEHRDQVDKIGNPYIEHVEWVAERARRHGHVVETVAWLHDIVEDTSVDLPTLAWFGYPKVVVDAVDAITRRPTEQYLSYIERVAADPIACVVKLIDLDHNTLPTRVQRLRHGDPGKAASLGHRYDRAKTRLLRARVEHLESLARFMVALDDPEGPGFEARRSITMNEIIKLARAALVTHEDVNEDGDLSQL